MNHDTDKQYRASVIAEVNETENGWTLKDAEGWWILCPNELCSTPPLPGEGMRLYGKGIGFVRGIVVQGRVYCYLTEAELDAEHEQWRADRIKRLEDELEATRAERDAKIAALPKLFRERIERFQRTLPNWRRDHEPYELFCCTEAVKIVRFVLENHPHTDEETLQRFRDDTEVQKVVLGTTLDDHSGNTFGQACLLAHRFLTNPETVVMSHGALCPLVGCTDYGCWAAYEGKLS